MFGSCSCVGEEEEEVPHIQLVSLNLLPIFNLGFLGRFGLLLARLIGNDCGLDSWPWCSYYLE